MTTRGVATARKLDTLEEIALSLKERKSVLLNLSAVIVKNQVTLVEIALKRRKRGLCSRQNLLKSLGNAATVTKLGTLPKSAVSLNLFEFNKH